MRLQIVTPSRMELSPGLDRIPIMEILDSDLERRIVVVRDIRVMLDEDLARIYGVTTARLNQQVLRNLHRFPHGFVLELSHEEVSAMRSQSVTSSRRNLRRLPRAFTEHGAIMLATVLNTPVAVEAAVRVVKAFVRMRELLATHAALQKKLDELENKVGAHDEQIQELFGAIRQLITPAGGPRRKIGFKAD